MKKLLRTLAVILGVILVLAVVLVQVALWKSHGNLFDFLAGQSDPGPALQSDISLKGSGAAPYDVQVQVDTIKVLAELPPEYLSFAIDTSQVVGGKWWDPNATGKEAGSGTVNAPSFDFNRPKLDAMVAGLGPAYMRLGGSEADKVYYDMTYRGPEPAPVPAGYKSTLSANQWDAANAFAARNHLNLIFTLNAGPGARRPDGSWDPTNAEALLKYTAEKGYSVAGWELGNELNIFWFVHGLSRQVSAQQYQADLQAACALVKRYSPASTCSGQGSAYWPLLGEPLNAFYGFMEPYLQGSGSLTQVVSWHYYPQQSRRGPIASRRAYPGRLLIPANLDEVGYWADQVRALRDRYAPGKPIWLGETGNAQFGGEPGLSDAYLGGLWWLDQLGLLARHDTQMVVRQSLTGMNYSLIDDQTLAPRPDYWNSVLWKKLMGQEVYQATPTGAQASSLRVYAQSTPGQPGSVTVLVINLNPTQPARVTLNGFDRRGYELYTLTAPDLFGRKVLLNGREMYFDAQGNPKVFSGEMHIGGDAPVITLNPLSYAFVVIQ